MEPKFRVTASTDTYNTLRKTAPDYIQKMIINGTIELFEDKIAPPNTIMVESINDDLNFLILSPNY